MAEVASGARTGARARRHCSARRANSTVHINRHCVHQRLRFRVDGEHIAPFFFTHCSGRMCVFTRSLPSVCYVLAPVGEHDLALALLRHQPDNTDDVEHGQLVRGRQDGARQCTLRPISGQSGDDKYANGRVVLCMAHRRRRDAPAACQRRQRALSRHGEHAST